MPDLTQLDLQLSIEKILDQYPQDQIDEQLRNLALSKNMPFIKVRRAHKIILQLRSERKTC